MREIKFRAWDSAHKFMTGNMSLIELADENDVLAEKRGLVFLQYTGLKDKNGKEIYEGDIVRILYTDWPSKLRHDVRSLEQYKKDISFIGEVVCYSLGCLELRNGDEHGSLDEGPHGEKEVIGNICEHKELLRGAK